MTRKHFEAIAAIIANRKGWPDSTIQFDQGYETALDHIEDDLADYFETVNPNFNRDKFLKACGL